MSRFTDKMFSNANESRGMVTGEPAAAVRRTWGEVHERARHIAGGLAAAGVGHHDAVAVLAGAPAEIAPTAQAIWMRGASLTMLHQPTPRTDLERWTQETAAVISLLGAQVVVVSDPFMAAAPVLCALGLTVVTVAELLEATPDVGVVTEDDDVAMMQLTSGSTGPPKAVTITHRNLESNAEAMFVGAEYNLDTDVIVSWLPLFHDMGMTGFLVVPMYFGAELVKVTPMDFLGDILLWARLIDKYRGTMTAAPNFAYALLAKRLRHQPDSATFDLTSLRWALSGAEQVDPTDVEDFCEASARFGLRPQAILPAYGMAETTVAVSFSACGGGIEVDEVDADILAALRRAVPNRHGRGRRLACLGPTLPGLEARIVDEDANLLPRRGVGVIQVRGASVSRGYRTVAGFVPTQDSLGWFDTGDLGYLTEHDHLVVCGRVKDIIIMGGRNIFPSDIERAAGRVSGVRAGCAVAVRLELEHRETFAVVVESNGHDDAALVRDIQLQVAHEVFVETNVRPRNVVVLGPGTIPKTPSGKLRRAAARSLIA
ncbi:long-chain fatty acid--CoA ligase [Mycobacterium sp. MS1601]|uniref:fatty acyl-AMP ligase n=1 Tax=Mycobacterium sp. MS1601 TaxID=1936029 RepID=UPI000979856C|nr:fatty acyl-AMP ligase [Mycobacterium sp. MS1601]AQA04309.1 long-chain fatty acid--CoA ligase [Mycobacterium sp. MS1601]